MGFFHISMGHRWRKTPGGGGGAFLQVLVSTPTRRGDDFAGCKACTARRRGVPFTRVRRRGLCSMSGRYPYGIGNPPTLRRSSFPQRALRPAGGPIPKHAWGCAPRPPNAKLRLDTNDAKASSVRRRRYTLKVPAAHFMWKFWMVRGRGGWGAGRRLAEGAVLQTIKYLLNCHLSSPPQRRGQGWWFALPRSSAGR